MFSSTVYLLGRQSIMGTKLNRCIYHCSSMCKLPTATLNSLILNYRHQIFNSKMLQHKIDCRLKSWWCKTRRPNLQLTTVSALTVEKRYNEDPKFGTRMQRTKERIQETKEKIQETKNIMEKRIGDMKENIFTIPNGLCVARISATPFLGYFVIQGMYVPAMALCIFAGMTDLLDGYIARNYANQKSKFGSFLDPAADKFLVATLFLTLTIRGFIPIPLTALIVTRDVCLVAAGFYIRYLSLPPPRTFLRYFDASLAVASVSPTTISKLNTAVQLTLVSISLAAPIFDFVDHPYLQTLWYVTAGTTVLSGLSYVFTKNTYQILSKVKKDKTK